jgi:Flp pilus assembly protein TadB
VTPAIFLALVALLLVLIVLHNPWQALAGAIVVGLGLPVYAVIERRRAYVAATPDPRSAA